MNKHTLQNLFDFIKQAQQERIQKGQFPNIEFNEQAALDWARFTEEEAGELVREFKFRKPWKEYEAVDKQAALLEAADVLIQLAMTVMYLGLTGEDLYNAVIKKMNTKRKDWK